MNTEPDSGAYVDFYVQGEDGPRRVNGVEQMNEAFDALLAKSNGNPARLYHSARPRLASGFPDHELQVAVDTDRGVGALRFGADGTWFTEGTVPPAGVATAGALYDYPENPEVPLNDVRAALAEFLETHELPTVVSWQEDTSDF